MSIQLGSKYFYTNADGVLTLEPTGRYVKERVTASFRDPEYEQDKYEFMVVEQSLDSVESSRVNYRIWLVEDDVQEIFYLQPKEEVPPLVVWKSPIDMSFQMDHAESQFDK